MNSDESEFFPTEYKYFFVNKNGDFINKNPHPLTKFVVKKYEDKDGYYRIWVKNSENKKKFIPAHRIVLSTFNPSGKHMTVNHINGNKKDNRLINLEWMTAEENNRHSFTHLGRKNKKGEGSSRHKIKNEDVIEIRTLYKNNGYTNKKLATLFNISEAQVNRIIRRKNWDHLK